MLNVFSVVMAYSITCPIIVPFGELSLQHTRGCSLSDWRRNGAPHQATSWSRRGPGTARGGEALGPGPGPGWGQLSALLAEHLLNECLSVWLGETGGMGSGAQGQLLALEVGLRGPAFALAALTARNWASQTCGDLKGAQVLTVK